jgi:TolB protein
MTDERLGRDLRSVDAQTTPRPEFVDALYARMIEEASRSGPMASSTSRRGTIRRGRGSILLVAALVVGGTLVGTVILGGGSNGPTAEVPLSPAALVPPVVSAQPTGPASEPSHLAVSSAPPDGRALGQEGSVVFELAKVGSLTRLMVLRPDGSVSEAAPGVPGTQVAAAWSPDGRSTAFAAAQPATPTAWRIWSVDADQASASLISTDCEPPSCTAESEPAYRHDGAGLAFVRTVANQEDGGTSTVIAIRDLTNDQVTELPSTRRAGAERLLHPSWSPDGTLIAFAVETRDADGIFVTSTIWLVNADGTGLRQLTAESLVAGDPVWSPDGTRILFGSQPIRSVWAENERGVATTHLYTMAPDGNDVRMLPIDGPVGAASWASDGDQILFTAILEAGAWSRGVTWLMTVDADATALASVMRSGGCCRWYAVQQPLP